MSSLRASITVIGIVFLLVTLGVIIPITRINDGNNETIGAVGVSGDTSDKDEYCAIQAILAASYKPDPPLPSETWRESKL